MLRVNLYCNTPFFINLNSYLRSFVPLDKVPYLWSWLWHSAASINHNKGRIWEELTINHRGSRLCPSRARRCFPHRSSPGVLAKIRFNCWSEQPFVSGALLDRRPGAGSERLHSREPQTRRKFVPPWNAERLFPALLVQTNNTREKREWFNYRPFLAMKPDNQEGSN